MDYAAYLAYFAALAALTAAPGPVVVVLVARSLGRDAKGATAFAAGLCLGDLIAVCAIALGVGVWAQDKPELFSVVKYVGVAYLLWLAAGMWNADFGTALLERRGGGWLASVGAGIALCLGNPSTLLIYVLLLPTVAPAGIMSLEHLALVVLVTFAAVGVVFFGAVVLARQFNKIIDTPASSALFSRVMAAIIAIASLWILAV